MYLGQVSDSVFISTIINIHDSVHNYCFYTKLKMKKSNDKDNERKGTYHSNHAKKPNENTTSSGELGIGMRQVNLAVQLCNSTTSWGHSP